jgi:hypothetical protein
LVTITGTGFSTTLADNVVQFEDAFATVLSATDTELQVRAGSSTITGDAEIKVFLKLSIESTCNIAAGCMMPYSDTGIPTVDTATSILTPQNGEVTIKGTNFGDNPVGYIGTYMQETVSSSATEIVIKLIKMDDNEALSFEVRTDTVSLPSIVLTLPVSQVLLSITPSVGSSGGQKITLSTIGIGESSASNLNIYYGSGSTSVSVCDTITVVSSSVIECVTTKNTDIATNTLMLSFTQTSSLTGRVSTVTLSCSDSADCQYETTVADTPTLSSVVKSNGDTQLDVTVSGLALDSTYAVNVYYGGVKVEADTIVSTTDLTFQFTDGFPPGVVDVQVSFEKDGNLLYSTSVTETIALAATASTPVTCSWAGGCEIRFDQQAIMQGAEVGDISVTVCGYAATLDLDGSTNSQLVARAPRYSNIHSLDNFKVEQSQQISGTVTSLPTSMGQFAFDGITSTMYKSNTDDNCYVQTDFGSGLVGRVDKLKFFMNRMTDKVTNFVDKLIFQSSADGSTWTDEYAADISLRVGWNTFTPATALKTQYYRFYSATKEACQIGEIQFWGNIVEDTSDTSKTCNVTLTAPGGQTLLFEDQVIYDDSASAVVNSISPRYGTYKGGEVVTFTGTGFPTTHTEVTVTIDNVVCSVISSSDTQITCTSGARPSIVADGETVVTFTGSTKIGYASMQELKYNYANYWSDLDTWSGEYIPQDGDTVSIPKGQTLLVDVDYSNQLVAVIVEGSLIFEPESDPTHHRWFDAEYIYVSENAVLEIGTETDRYTSMLTITMHGTRESAQIPDYGNKGIFVRYGKLDMHGNERDYTWTELGVTMNFGDNQATLKTAVDWQVGEEIVIAPTDFNVDHAEAFKISAIDNTGSTTVLTLNTTAKYKHYSGSKEYNVTNDIGNQLNKTLEMRAEVGLLTRNVVYQGADDDSIANKYGAHVMMHSPGDDSLTGRISYCEFRQVGQAFQLGRYPIHFHMVGTLHNSYIKGNSIHHTYNRACTIHGVHYLTIEQNVAYETMGHTFFIEDGGETKNILLNNLAIKTKRSWSLLNTDQTPASFWITHPDNQFIGNHAAGSDRYGFWFDLQTNPTGPSFDSNICPEYEQLGEFTGNVAHSNGRYGLRIFHRFNPSDNPCNPSSGNHIETHFRDFLGYKNVRTAIIAEELGSLRFHNIRVADNLLSGVEFGITDVGPWLNSSSVDYHLQD